MKKLLFVAAIILFTGTVFGQTLQKGAALAIRNFTIILNPDVTMNQFLDFYINKCIPEFEKNYPGTKEFILSGNMRREKKSVCRGIIF